MLYIGNLMLDIFNKKLIKNNIKLNITNNNVR